MMTKINNRRGGFTLVEIMIVVAIIALLAAIAIPSALRARKRGQATSTLETCRLLDAAKDQWAIEFGKSSTSTITAKDIAPYIKKGSPLEKLLSVGSSGKDALGTAITINSVDEAPTIDATTFNALSDVVASDFFGPYYSAAS